MLILTLSGNHMGFLVILQVMVASLLQLPSILCIISTSLPPQSLGVWGSTASIFSGGLFVPVG